METKNEEFNYKSKSNNNFNNKENNSKLPEGLNNYKHCLPSFLIDDYFQQASDCEDDSSEDKEDNKKNNSFDNTKEGQNNSKNLFEEKTTENTSNNEEIKNNIIYNNNININNISDNNIGNNNTIRNNGNNTNIFNSFPPYPGKNFMANSFNNNNSINYYQNYLNSINKMNQMPNFEPNYNILNNNINIINNNNFMNAKSNPYFHPNNNINTNTNNFPQAFSFNSLPTKNMYNQSMNEINNQNYMNNLIYNNEINLNKNMFNPNLTWNQPKIPINNNLKNDYTEKNKRSKKRNKKESQEESNIIKKMLNMSDYSLCNFLKNQKDSREAQNALTNMKENEVEILINKLKNYISDVTIDKYGNYFTQKLIQICVPSQRVKIIQNINTRFVEIALNSFGTHPLQSLMEIINMPEEKKLILKYILGNEIALSFDTKGTHILQKYISNTKDEDRYELNVNIVNLIDKLIVDISGVCVLIKLIKHSKDKILLEKVANYITNHEPLFFIQHPYANYAVQVLIMNPVALPFCDKIIETIVNNYLSLSMQKFSSNVVENCIKFADEKSVKKIYNAIIDQEKVESLLNNNYGNYVLEKLIERLNKEDKIKLAKKIEKFGKNKILSNCLKTII